MAEPQEESITVETSIGKVAAKGGLIIPIVLMVTSVALLIYGMELHHRATIHSLESVDKNTRMTNCLLAIPQEQRKDSWRLRECVLNNELVPVNPRRE